jgi:hypothetical protein
MSTPGSATQALALYRKFTQRLTTTWPEFLRRREQWLCQLSRNGTAAEKVAENIIEDFFTVALDWSIETFNHQLNRAYMVLSRLGQKRLLIEAKRPDSLAPESASLEKALLQAERYATEQSVKSIVVSDGTYLHTVDLINGGRRIRCAVRLDTPEAPLETWWVSVNGVYREVDALEADVLIDSIRTTDEPAQCAVEEIGEPSVLLHHKHKVPHQCFAYVGNVLDTKTWKLLYRFPDGTVDAKHLPGAIRAIASVYRGVSVKDIPEEAVGDVLVRLALAAKAIRKLPGQTAKVQYSYQQLFDALSALGRLGELGELV